MKDKLGRFLKLARTNLANNIIKEVDKSQKFLHDILEKSGSVLLPYLNQVLGTSAAISQNVKLREKIKTYNGYLSEMMFYNSEYIRTLKAEVMNAFIDAAGSHMNALYGDRKQTISDGKKKVSVLEPDLFIEDDSDDNKKKNEIPDDEAEEDE